MTDQTSEKRIKELVKLLNEAAKAYYAEDREIMDNFTYDKLYDELSTLEKETGIIMSDSPTQNVGYTAVEELPKVQHASPMLSLDKTKEPEVLKSFIGTQSALISWKMDGLTIVLSYENGKLARAVTRGNGIIGEDVTNNARVFKDIPLSIPFKGSLTIRGEAYITYTDFEVINSGIEDVDAKYKNPRNLCSGSVRQLSNEITAKRNVRLKVFNLVSAEGVDFGNSHEKEFIWLKDQGFDVVEYKVTTQENFEEVMAYFAGQISKNDFPSDGLVALYDDIEYGRSLGTTAKFPRNSFAFKWADEEKETKLLEIEWSPSRTGLLNPVAIFEPVELEGTTVSRASVHNVSILKELELGIGDTLLIYKANMIIPQISENLTRSGSVKPPCSCPACGAETKINSANGVETLICPNPDCPAKAMKSYSLFVSRDAMNIEGMSESTLEKFMAHGLVKSFADLFRLEEHKDIIVNMEGFGEKSFNNLTEAARKASKTTPARLITAMGIPNIGTAGAKVLCKAFGDDIEKIKSASREEIEAIEGMGPITARLYEEWWKNDKNRESFEELMPFLTIEKSLLPADGGTLDGKVFVVTGSLAKYANRNELKKRIESKGGKVTGSVTSKTDYLINNDIASTSSKNKTAKSLGVPIISEDDFINMFDS